MIRGAPLVRVPTRRVRSIRRITAASSGAYTRYTYCRPSTAGSPASRHSHLLLMPLSGPPTARWGCTRARVARRHAPAGEERRDLIRKEEIPARRVHSVWDAEMLPFGDAPRRRG
ncbi:hypothetical protein SHO565_25690 [Streptomyces sp. HO565]